MYCRKCGKVVIGDNEYCNDCKELMKIVCPYCGKKTDANDKFCKHCEGYIGKDSKASVSPTQPKPNVDTKTCLSCGSIIPKSAFYCPICKKMSNSTPVAQTTSIDKGSYAGGFLLGFLLGLIGFIIALCINKEETKRGALHAFLISLVIGIIAVIAVCCVTCQVVSNIPSHY